MNLHPKLLTFLLVEDDDAHAKIVIRTFEKERIGNKVIRVKDGEQAMSYLRQEGSYASVDLPDIVLLDLNLPKINGIEILKNIKGDDRLSHLPVVILTTSEAEQDKLKAYQHHVNSYLVKPAEPDDFKKMVHELNFYWGILNEPAKPKVTPQKKKGVGHE